MAALLASTDVYPRLIFSGLGVVEVYHCTRTSIPFVVKIVVMVGRSARVPIRLVEEAVIISNFSS